MMTRNEEEQELFLAEVAQWLETWTENNALPGTMPEDDAPCSDAILFKETCLKAAQEEGYSEEDLLQIDFVDGDLDMYFDRAARQNFRINTGR